MAGENFNQMIKDFLGQAGASTSYDDPDVQTALGYADDAIGAQRAAGGRAISRLEGTMYDVLGREQLSREQDIKSRRTQALRSGMTSSQLAAQEMQNLLAGQVGAQQIAQQYDQQRFDYMTETAGAEDQARVDMFATLETNKANNLAAITEMFASNDMFASIAMNPNLSPRDALEMDLARRGIDSDDVSYILDIYDSVGNVKVPDDPNEEDSNTSLDEYTPNAERMESLWDDVTQGLNNVLASIGESDFVGGIITDLSSKSDVSHFRQFHPGDLTHDEIVKLIIEDQADYMRSGGSMFDANGFEQWLKETYLN